ncbi:MAG: hypothetical protein H6830_08595 [Planctomycetes bacterium]|nr:hypothetical protein [Planctomycetota bacterium]MCB9909667.1 hypothetical protein [Planctomycetota bacterium]MCB9911844.1 hypothetical protein [Planctomycetota bacterium]HPF13343.1 Wzz/FepE/Etk N-terminal domain-containing protein [Planctomycetota bacterium]
MQADQEQHGDDEWGGITHLFGLVRRYPLMILGTTVLAGLAGFAASTTVGPQYESSIFLGLEDWRAQNPVLEGLQIPGGTQDSKDAYSVLRSQEVLDLVVSDPEAGPEPFRLGLTQQVIEQPMSPWQRATALVRRRGPGASLGFRLTDANASTHLDWTLYFEDERVVWVAPTETTQGPLLRVFGPGMGPEAQRLALGDDGEISYRNTSVRLSAGPGLTGRTFRIRTRTREQAIAELRRGLEVQLPSDRNQVVRLVVRDSQAERARQVVQALTEAFLFHESHRNEESAQAVVTYLDQELAGRKEELATLDGSIEALRSQNPDLLHPEQAAVYLQAQREVAWAEIQQLEPRIALLETANKDLAEGRHDSILPVREALTDARFDRWLDRIDQIEATLQIGLDPGSNARQAALQEDWQRARSALREAQRRAAEFERSLTAFRAGEDGQLAAMVELLTVPGNPPTNALIGTEITPYRQAQADLAQALAIYNENQDAVQIARQWLETRTQTLASALDAQLERLQDQVGHCTEDCQLLELQLKVWPQEQLEDLVQSKLSLWGKVRAAIQSELEHSKTRLADWQARVGELEGRLMQLPVDQTALDLPILEREGLHAKIDALIAKREDAKIALAGLRPTAQVLEPAVEPQLRQPHLNLLGWLAGTLVGLLGCLTLAQFRSTRDQGQRRQHEELLKDLPQLELPVLARMPQRAEDHSFAQGSPLKPDMLGPAFAALRRLRVQLGLLGKRGWDTALLGVMGLEDPDGDLASRRGARSDAYRGQHQASLASATVVGLALTHALAGRRALVIDADPLSANLSASLGLGSYPGLTECLTGESDWTKCLVTTGPSKLEILPAGTVECVRSTLYAMPAWSRLLEDVRGRYDVVLLHVPHLARAKEFERLAPKLGSLLVVADPSHFPHATEFERLLLPLRRAGTRLVGLFQAGHGQARDSNTDAA